MVKLHQTVKQIPHLPFYSKSNEAHILTLDLYATCLIVSQECWDKQYHIVLFQRWGVANFCNWLGAAVDSEVSFLLTVVALHIFGRTQVAWMESPPRLIYFKGGGHAVEDLDEWDWYLLPF